MAKLRYYLKKALKFLFISFVWDRVKTMLWKKTKRKAKQKVKRKTSRDLDPVEPEWKDEEIA